MRRSSLALIVVVLIIAGAVILLTRSGPEPPVTPEGPKPTTAAEPAIEKPAPTTATPSETAVPKPEEVEKAEPPTAEAVLAAAEAELKAGKPAGAMKALSDAIAKGPKPGDLQAIKTRLAKLATEALFSAKPCPPLSVAYTVRAGDKLERIAKSHKTTIALITRLNKIENPDLIRVGQCLKIIPGGFDVEVVKSQFRLTVSKDGLWVREYKVGLGKDGSTPVGEFVAGHKLKEPAYFGDGSPVPYGDKKNNPLGTRWITVKGAGAGQYGIHGTWEPDSVGKEESKGCVRMRNEDVEWLYALIVPGQSKVVIKP